MLLHAFLYMHIYIYVFGICMCVYICIWCMHVSVLCVCMCVGIQGQLSGGMHVWVTMGIEIHGWGSSFTSSSYFLRQCLTKPGVHWLLHWLASDSREFASIPHSELYCFQQLFHGRCGSSHDLMLPWQASSCRSCLSNTLSFLVESSIAVFTDIIKVSQHLRKHIDKISLFGWHLTG